MSSYAEEKKRQSFEAYLGKINLEFPGAFAENLTYSRGLSPNLSVNLDGIISSRFSFLGLGSVLHSDRRREEKKLVTHKNFGRINREWLTIWLDELGLDKKKI